MGSRFADQRAAGKHLGLLLSEMSALTRPLSGMIWVAVLGAGVKRDRPEEHARTRPKAQALPDHQLQLQAAAAATRRRGHARAREGACRDRGVEAGDNLVSGLAWVPGPETARVPAPPPRHHATFGVST